MPVIRVITVCTYHSQIMKLKNKTSSNFKEIGRNSVIFFVCIISEGCLFVDYYCLQLSVLPSRLIHILAH
jgi:hypothetical protein